MNNQDERTQEIAVPHEGTDVRVIPPQTRTIPMGAFGTNGTQVAASQAVELGAILGALGLEKGAVASLLEDLQRITMSTHLQALPAILDRLREANKTRINSIIQRVNLLPDMSQTGFWQRMNGQAAPYLVTRDAVLAILNQALDSNLSIS